MTPSVLLNCLFSNFFLTAWSLVFLNPCSLFFLRTCACDLFPFSVLHDSFGRVLPHFVFLAHFGLASSFSVSSKPIPKVSCFAFHPISSFLLCSAVCPSFRWSGFALFVFFLHLLPFSSCCVLFRIPSSFRGIIRGCLFLLSWQETSQSAGGTFLPLYLFTFSSSLRALRVASFVSGKEEIME